MINVGHIETQEGVVLQRMFFAGPFGHEHPIASESALLVAGGRSGVSACSQMNHVCESPNLSQIQVFGLVLINLQAVCNARASMFLPYET